MKIIVRAHHVEITKALREYAEDKLGKLEKYFDHIIQMTVELDILDNANVDDRQEVRVSIKIPNRTLRAVDSSKDMYATIDKIHDMCMVQLKRYKEKKMINYRNKGYKEELFIRRFGPSPSNEKKKKDDRLYVPKPMGPEDAVMVLEEDHLPFVVFRNMESDKINVVYPLDSGYGLIET